MEGIGPHRTIQSAIGISSAYQAYPRVHPDCILLRHLGTALPRQHDPAGSDRRSLDRAWPRTQRGVRGGIAVRCRHDDRSGRGGHLAAGGGSAAAGRHALRAPEPVQRGATRGSRSGRVGRWVRRHFRARRDRDLSAGGRHARLDRSAASGDRRRTAFRLGCLVRSGGGASLAPIARHGRLSEHLRHPRADPRLLRLVRSAGGGARVSWQASGLPQWSR